MKWSETKRIEDLTWGINQLDYPSEIDNKQAQDITNFNFEGNKLVSSKWIEQKLSVATPIQWVKIDSNDIWYVTNQKIVKNGDILADWVWILVTTNTTSFKAWVKFYITIEGIDYIISWLTVEDFILNLKAAVEANWLLTLSQPNLILIYKADWTAVSYTITENTAYIIYNFDNKTVTPYNFWTDYVWSVVIDWTTYSWVYTPSSPALNQGQIDIEFMDQLFDELPALMDKEKIFLDTSFKIVKDYEFYAWILLNWVNSVSFSTKQAYSITRVNWYWNNSTPYVGFSLDWTTINWLMAFLIILWWGSVDMVWTINVDWQIINVNWTYTDATLRSLIITSLNSSIYTFSQLDWSFFSYAKKTWFPSVTTIDILVNWTSQWTASSQQYDWPLNTQLVFNDNALRDIFIYNVEQLWLYDVRENSSTWVLGLHIRKLDLSDLSSIWWNWLTHTKTTRNSVDIRGNLYESVWVDVTQLVNNNWLQWKTNLVIWNSWVLTLDISEWWAYYWYDWVNIEIGEESVWKPTVWTIYNWKVVLGGYPDNDNIVFSKTSSVTMPLNVLQFNWYDAWGQSVSWGDKGLITWMSVWENWLYVFKDNSIWYTNSEKDNPTSLSFNFIFRKITSNWAYSQSVITQVEQDIFYLDWKEKSVRRLSYEQNLTTLRDTAISRDIEPILKALPEDQSLATSSYTYPNYRLYVSDHTWPTITYPNWKTYNTNNVCLTYNVYNKSWTKEQIGNVIVSNEKIVALNDNNIYELEKGNLNKSWEYISKRYSEGDDFIKKKINRTDVLAKLIPEDWESLTLQVDVINDYWSIISSFSHTSTQEEKVALRKHLYFISETVTFVISYTGKWKVEVYDLFYNLKPTKIGR